MIRSRFLWKLYAGYAVLILVSAALVGVLTARQIERDTLDEIRDSLRARAAMLKQAAWPASRGESAETLQSRVRALGEEIHTRLTVIRSDGTVLADSEKDPARMDDHSNRPEILAARSHGFGTAIRFSNTLETRMMYVALPVRSGNHLVGFVRASLPLSVIDERLDHLRSIVVFGAAVAALVALVLGFFMARGFAAPLASMTAVAESMSRGDYNQRLPVGRSDEVGRLAEAFNRMARSLRERMERITTDHNKLLTILAGMVEGVIAVDREERIMHLNAVAADILGTSEDDAIDKKIWEVIRVPEVCDLIATVLRRGTQAGREVHLVGTERNLHLQLQAAPLRDGEGRPVGAVVVLHDVTELHRLETVRRDFVSNASHELKTPITAIRGLIETLINDRRMDPETHDRFLERIADQANRLDTLVNDLLALSRLESAELVLEHTPTDLGKIVHEVVDTIRPSADRKGLALTATLPTGGAKISGDREALRQMAANLLDNALKYTPCGGRIAVRLRVEQEQAVLEVADTGIGIEPQHLDRIFERFYRVDKGRSRELGGTGLGLSIVKHVVLAHGGEVTVTSTPGSGSTFVVRLPLASDEPA